MMKFISGDHSIARSSFDPQHNRPSNGGCCVAQYTKWRKEGTNTASESTTPRPSSGVRRTASVEFFGCGRSFASQCIAIGQWCGAVRCGTIRAERRYGTVPYNSGGTNELITSELTTAPPVYI